MVDPLSEKTSYDPRSDDPWAKVNYEGRKEIPKFIEIIASNAALAPTILVIITTIYYIYIYRYYSAFFERLSIPLASLDLPFTFYLSAGIKILPWLFLVFVIVFNIISIYILHLGKRFNEYRYFEDAAPQGDKTYKLFLNETMNKTARFFKLIGYIVVPVLLLFLLIFSPTIQGNLDAQNLIRGESNVPEIAMTWNENGVNLTNSSLILVLYNNKNYYFVEKNISAPLHPKSYIIPDTEIKMVAFK